MKKVLILFILITVACQSKAQQLFKVSPADGLANILFDKYFKSTPNAQFQLFYRQIKPNETLAAVNLKRFENRNIVDRMPIAVLEGYSKMPVVKLGGYYTMPVVRIGSNDDLFNLQKSLQGQPVIKNPY